jgi:hypothetical protein
MKIEVKHTPIGWIVVDGVTMGPFAIRSRAIDLAEGMVQALRSSGETVELIVEHDQVRGAVAD